MLIVRPAKPEDAPAIQRLNKEGLGYDYPLEKTRVLLDSLCGREDQCVLVAELDGELVVGYIHLENYQTLYFAPMKNVLGIAVFPEYRRTGVATKLLTAGEQWAKETGASGIRLNSGSTREDAHAFYEHLGYESNKLQKHFIKML